MNIQTSHLDLLQRRIPIQIPIENRKRPFRLLPVPETPRNIRQDEPGTIRGTEGIVDSSGEVFRFVRRTESGNDHGGRRVRLENSFTGNFGSDSTDYGRGGLSDPDRDD